MEDDLSARFSSSEFRNRLAEGFFSVIRCRSCSKYVVPPTSICSNCLSRNLEWIEISRTGAVVTYSEIHVPASEFQDLAPYIVAIIEMDGSGIRLPGIVRGANLNDLTIGSRVKVNLEQAKSRYFFSLIH